MNEYTEKSFINLFEIVRNNYRFYYGTKYNDDKSCSDFIADFIERSGKRKISLFDAIKYIEKKYAFRLNHIVNVFLLGIYLYYDCMIIRTSIDDELKHFNEQNKTERYEFDFIWFLICLFHDLGYKKEEDSKKMLAIYLNNEIVKLKQSNLGEITGVPTLYKDILNYLDYRKERFACIDHGIYAGRVLYNGLCDIRREHENDDNHSNLSWSVDLENVYNYAAWIISAHNIFFAKSSFDKKLYKKYKLDKLIIEPDEYPISLNAYPMFYLFCLVDSLEPIKVFRDKELLRSLFLTISDKELKIRSEIRCGCHSSYFDKVKSLNDWLTPVKLDDRTRTLHIQFNFSLFGCRDVF